MKATWRVDKLIDNSKRTRMIAWFVEYGDAWDYIHAFANDPLNVTFSFRIVKEE